MNRRVKKNLPLQRVLVTGGAGFIGSHTVDVLLRQGKEVVVLDNLTTGSLEHLDMQHPNLEFIEGDVLEYPFLHELMMKCDAVLHLAAIVSVPESIRHPIYTFQVNTQGFLHVLQAAHNIEHAIRIVHASSAAVYGNVNELPCRDDMPLTADPLSPYALQKIHCEDYAHLYDRLHGVKSLGLRYFNIYGPRQDPTSPYSGVISRFLDAYKNDADLMIFGDGMQSRDFIHVTDVAKANVLALQSDYAGVLNIATGQPTTLLDVVECIKAAGKKHAELLFDEARQGDIRSSYAAVGLAQEKIGFSASMSLEKGLEMLVTEARN